MFLLTVSFILRLILTTGLIIFFYFVCLVVCRVIVSLNANFLLYPAYMLILENDTNAEVRRAVLSCIAMSPRTLPKVLKRTRDIKENVRKLAYQVTMNAKICINCKFNAEICSKTSISDFCLRFWLTRFTLKPLASHRE